MFLMQQHFRRTSIHMCCRRENIYLIFGAKKSNKFHSHFFVTRREISHMFFQYQKSSIFPQKMNFLIKVTARLYKGQCFVYPSFLIPLRVSFTSIILNEKKEKSIYSSFQSFVGHRQDTISSKREVTMKK